MSVPYAPPKYAQIDGTAFGNSNCVLAISTELVDRVTLGRVRIPAWRLRIISKDTVGGVSLTQAAEAVSNATHGAVHLDALYGLNRNEVRDLAASGRPFGIIIDCSVTRWTSRRTNWFTGQHGIYVNQYRFTERGQCDCEKQNPDDHPPRPPHGEYLCEDPGTTGAGYLWWSADLLYRAAEQALGGPISVLAGRDTESVTRTARSKARLRGSPNVKGTNKGPVVAGQTYKVVSTTSGGPWKRDDGTDAWGWHRTAAGYIKGEALR